MNEIRCLCASGQLGHGIPIPALEAGVARQPHFIGADMGSTDIGPYYLGSGEIESEISIVRRDLELVLLAGRRLGVPVVLGTAGSAGGEPHLAATVAVVHEIARKHRMTFRLAVIHAEVAPEVVLAGLEEGRITPCGQVPELTPERIGRAARIVGQMGIEPFIRALEAGADVVIAGRACDAAVFAAYPIMKGADPGLAMHAAKIIECSSLAAEPGGRDAILATIRDDHFEVESMNPARRCTPVSVAAHSLYEQPNPYEVVEPGGRLDMTNSVFTAIDHRRTRVSGSRWELNPTYTIKLEGVEPVGWRSFSFGAIRCPIATAQIGAILDSIAAMVRDLLRGDVDEADYRLKFRTYGLNGAMGEGESGEGRPVEVTVVTDVVGRTPEIAKSVCSVARYNLLHYFYDGILATGGNIAIPFVPSDIQLGVAYEFSIYHLIETADPLALFPMDLIDLKNGESLGQAA